MNKSIYMELCNFLSSKKEQHLALLNAVKKKTKSDLIAEITFKILLEDRRGILVDQSDKIPVSGNQSIDSIIYTSVMEIILASIIGDIEMQQAH